MTTGASNTPTIGGAAARRAASTTVACAHCTLPVPRGLIDPASDLQFCCEGCRAVHETILGCGLGDYYRLRDSGAEMAAAPAHPEGGKFDSFDSAAFESLYVTTLGDAKQSPLILEGLTCGACVWLIEKLPDALDGVIESRLNLREAQVLVTWDPTRVTLSKIAALLDRFGYTPHPAKGTTRQSLEQARVRTMLIDIGIAFALMGNLMLISAALYAGWTGHMDAGMTRLFRIFATVLGVASLAGPGRCFFMNAWRAIRNRAANLDLPIALALVAGGVAGVANALVGRDELYFDSLSMLVFLLLVGRYLQHRQQRRADASVELLFDLMPSTVRVWRDGQFVDLPSEALQRDDLVEVRPGELIPGDGNVERGRSSIDSAVLTGESLPATVAAGDAVFGGSVNREATLQIRLATVGRDTRVGRLMDLVAQGLAEKPQAMRFADSIGRWFIPAVCLAAAGTFAYWAPIDLERAIDYAIAMLIVTCPCILGLATPLTMAVSIGQLARRNILVKSAAALERLEAVRTVVFDKTGTLTYGDLRVSRFSGDERWKPTIAAIEREFTHPAARAIVAAFESAATNDLPAPREIAACGSSGVRALVGDQRVLIGSSRLMIEHGVDPTAHPDAAAGNVYVAVDDRLVATILFADSVRADALQTVTTLRRAGVDILLLSGDAPEVTHRVAEALNIPRAAALGHVTPEQKLRATRDRQDGGSVAMVGDGVNDAAALAAADVGIAVRGGAETSLSAADVYIAAPGLAPIAELFGVARHTMRIVRRNFAITLTYNLVAGALAATGYMNPLVAAVLMPISSATTIGFATLSMRRGTRRLP